MNHFIPDASQFRKYLISFFLLLLLVLVVACVGVCR